MKIKAFLLYFIVFTLNTTVKAINKCQLLFDSPLEISLIKILEERNLSLIKPEVETIIVNNRSYYIKKLLGRGGVNNVYLATNSKGEFVVVKQLSNHFHPQNLLEPQQLYEELATTYLLNQKIDVPKIIDKDTTNKFLVKEYFEGLTFHDIRNKISSLEKAMSELPFSWSEDYTIEIENRKNILIAERNSFLKLIEELTNEQNRFKKIHQGFREWLKSGTQLSQEHFRLLNDMIEQGDYKAGDFIFSIHKHKWLLIDP